MLNTYSGCNNSTEIILLSNGSVLPVVTDFVVLSTLYTDGKGEMSVQTDVPHVFHRDIQTSPILEVITPQERKKWRFV